MSGDDLAPDDSSLALDGVSGSVDVSDTLSEVERSILLVVQSLNLEESGVGVLASERSAVT